MPIQKMRQESLRDQLEAPSKDRFYRAMGQVEAVLEQLEFSRLRFVLRLESSTELPDYYGSTLRGGLGVRFRQLVCVQPQIQHCRECALLRQCAFPYIFETPLPLEVRDAAHLQQVSPYLLVPVSDGGRKVAGSRLEFDLVLFGRAINYLPYFVISYRQLGETSGLGRQRTRFRLLQVLDRTPGAAPQLLYSAESGSINIQPQRAAVGGLMPSMAESVNGVTIRAVTPMRIKAQEKITYRPSFRALCAALLRRVSQLAVVHGPGAWDVDAGAILDAATEIAGNYDDLSVGEWERYSARQGQRIWMRGAVGCMAYRGEVAPFLPLLWAGQYTHVGRGSTFGNGRYEVYLNG